MTEPYVITHSGRKFPFANPKAEDIRLDDIAHGLSGVNRYAGQRPLAFSVAAHSIVVAEIVDPRRDQPHLRLQALLHDAAEAYIGDVPKPVRDFMRAAGDTSLDAIEDGIQGAISASLGFFRGSHKWDAELIKGADRMALALEVASIENTMRAIVAAEPNRDGVSRVLTEPKDWGFEDEAWPQDILRVVLMLSNVPQNHANIAYILELEAVTRTLQERDPTLGDRLAAMLADAATRSTAFVSKNRGRVKFLLEECVALPGFMKIPLTDATDTMAAALAGQYDPKKYGNDDIVAHASATIMGAGLTMGGALLDLLTSGDLDLELAKDDPARAVYNFYQDKGMTHGGTVTASAIAEAAAETARRH